MTDQLNVTNIGVLYRAQFYQCFIIYWYPPQRYSMTKKRKWNSQSPPWTPLALNDNARWLCPESKCSITPEDKRWTTCHLFGFCVIDTDETRGLLKDQNRELYDQASKSEDVAYMSNLSEASTCTHEWRDASGTWQRCGFNRFQFPNFPTRSGRLGYYDPTIQAGLELAKRRHGATSYFQHLGITAADDSANIHRNTWYCPQCSVDMDDIRFKNIDFSLWLSHTQTTQENRLHGHNNRFMRVQIDESHERICFINVFGKNAGRDVPCGFRCQNKKYGKGPLPQFKDVPCDYVYGKEPEWRIDESRWNLNLATF